MKADKTPAACKEIAISDLNPFRTIINRLSQSPANSLYQKSVNNKPLSGRFRFTESRIDRWGYVFVLPFVIVYALCQLYPVIYTFILSFSDLYRLKQSSDLQFVGFANYHRLIHDPFFWHAVMNTFVIWISCFIPQLSVALVLSIWLSDIRLKLKGKSLFRALIYMPNLLTATAIALLFSRFFSYPIGPVNQFLQNTLGIYDTVLVGGIETKQAFDFFRNPLSSKLIIAFIQWWMWYGYTVILLMAGITSIPQTLYEAAIVDGAHNWQLTWHITLPMLRPVMLYVLVTSMIGGMQMFDIPFIISSSGAAPDRIRTTSMYFYMVSFRGVNNYAYGAAISIGMFVITLLLALIIFLFMREKRSS